MENINLQNTSEEASAIPEPSNAIASTSSFATPKAEAATRIVHIPYILNGELYEIQTQEGENVTVKCCNCPPDRVYRGSVRSTGNFHMHIKRRHPDLLGKLHEMKVNALLERRDRLIRGRKLSNRRPIRMKREPKQEAPGSSSAGAVIEAPLRLSLMHTHKFKIRTAFQRHQLQHQQQQIEQQQQQVPANWNVISMTQTTGHSEPINFSLKENQLESSEAHDNRMEKEHAEIPNFHEKNMQAPSAVSCAEPSVLFGNVTCQPEQSTNVSTYLNNAVNDFYECPTAAVTPCPSVISTYGSQGSLSHTQYNNSFALVKNEHLMPEQAIDLTKNSTGLSSGIGLSETCSARLDAEASGICRENIETKHSRWEELLLHIEAALQHMQREMQTRNQIETNRMFLDLAKFKYLNPGFNYEC